MVRVTGALAVVERQAVAVAIVLVASVAAAAVGLDGAAAVVGGATVLVSLVVAMATFPGPPMVWPWVAAAAAELGSLRNCCGPLALIRAA
jgi:hypothetical protein